MILQKEKDCTTYCISRCWRKRRINFTTYCSNDEYFSIDGEIVVADPHTVEENLGNQLFIRPDVGKYKAEVLARRYKAGYNVPISSFTSQYIEDIETRKELFGNKYDLLKTT